MEPGTRPLPAWFDDAKLGIFVHWTAAAVPAFAPVTDSPFDLAADGGWEEAMRCSPYVEWYQNSIAIEGSPAALHHAEVHGNRPYDDFVEHVPRRPRRLAAPSRGPTCSQAAGARYVVLVTKHHDGVLLWPSDTPNPHKPRWASERDLVGDLAAAVRARDLRFGTYYSGGLDWTFGGLPITRLPGDVRAPSRRRPSTSPTPTRTGTSSSSATGPTCCGTTSATRPPPTSTALFERYYAAVPDGVVNNRFDWMGQTAGAVHCDFVTPEYSTKGDAEPEVGEHPRHRHVASATTARRPTTAYLSPDALVRMFVDVVAHGGNLLLNVGPNADGDDPVGAGAAAARPRLVAPHQRRRDLRHPSVDPHRRHHRRGPRRPLHDAGRRGLRHRLRHARRATASSSTSRPRPAPTVHLLGHDAALAWTPTAPAARVTLPVRPAEAPAFALRLSERRPRTSRSARRRTRG